MPSPWMLGRVAFVRTDVSEERSASIIKVERIGELGTTLHSSETSASTRATRRNIPEDGILHIRCRGNLKSCMFLKNCIFVPQVIKICLCEN
jgi:hypothetical protein